MQGEFLKSGNDCSGGTGKSQKSRYSWASSVSAVRAMLLLIAVVFVSEEVLMGRYGAWKHALGPPGLLLIGRRCSVAQVIFLS